LVKNRVASPWIAAASCRASGRPIE